MLAYCLPAAYVTLWPDTVRDLGSSLTLARGEGIPLLGPGPINQGPFAGPAWVWLQAPPLFFVQTFVAASVYVAFIASLKFPALYALGRRISGPRLGVCMAAAAAFPSLAIYEWMVFWHPNWLEVTIALALVLMVIADQRKSLGMLYAAAIACGLAVQMHVTAFFYLPLLAVLLYRIGVRGPRLAAHFVAMVLLVFLWFAPTLFVPAAERGLLEGATRRMATDASRFDPLAVLVALRTACIDYPLAIGETYGRAAHVPSWLWTAGVAIVWSAIVAGAIVRLRTREGRNFFLAVLALFLAGWTIAVAIRWYTSFYLVYFTLPLVAMLFGLSLEAAMSSRWTFLRGISATAVGLLVLSLFAAAYGARAVGRSGFIETRILAIGDIAHPADVQVKSVYVTVAARDAIAQEACALAAPSVALHGEVAYAIAQSMGFDFRLHCPKSTGRFVLFGNSSAAHLAAIPESLAPSLGIHQGKPARGLRLLTSVRPIYPNEARPIDTRFGWFELLLDRKPVQKIAVEVDTNPGELVAVYRHKPYDSLWKGFAVTQEGKAVAPAFETVNSWIYPAGERAARWKVEVETDAPQWVEVLAIRR